MELVAEESSGAAVVVGSGLRTREVDGFGGFTPDLEHLESGAADRCRTSSDSERRLQHPAGDRRRRLPARACSYEHHGHGDARL